MTEPTDALLPCPFCGEAAKHSFNSLYGDMSMASCKSCGATAYAPKWNRRAVLAKWGQPAQAAEPVARTLASHAAGEAGYCLFSRPVPSETPLYAASKPDPAYSAACNLATALFKKHFAHLPDFASGQAVWSLCDSTAGVISQIDNMVSGLVQPPTASPQADSGLEDDAAREAIEKVLALFPFNVPIQKFTVNNGPCLTADNDDEFYSVKRVLAFLTEIKTTLDAARKQGATQ